MKCGTVIITWLAFLVGILAQKPGEDQQYPFQTKTRDACVMSISGQAEIRIKLQCKNQQKNYLCEFASKPSYCRAYNSDSKGFWEQLSQDLKKVGNPCEPQMFKHSKCPKAPAPSQFKQVNPSGNQQDDTEKKPSPQKKPVIKEEPKKTKNVEQENPKAMKIAKDHCSWFFQTFCSYIIEIFV